MAVPTTLAQSPLAIKLDSTASLHSILLPAFKVGTLDSLILLCDELEKGTAMVEGVVLKIADSLRGLLKNNEAGIQGQGQGQASASTGTGTSHGKYNSLSTEMMVAEKTIQTYLHTFTWNTMKYRSDKTLKELADTITQEVVALDSQLKTKQATYTALTQSLATINRRTTGNLSLCTIADIVKKEHVVEGSEYLTTLFVAVPKHELKLWNQEYELLTAMVVPRSSIILKEDDDYTLVNVTLFKKVVDEFTGKCREKKWVVRDFVWDPVLLSTEKKQQIELVASEKEQWNSLVRLCRANFSEGYASYVHLKMLRVFIESVLRYGLPPDFSYILVHVLQKGKGDKVRKQVSKEFAGADGGRLVDAGAADHDRHELEGGDTDWGLVLFSLNAVA